VRILGQRIVSARSLRPAVTRAWWTATGVAVAGAVAVALGAAQAARASASASASAPASEAEAEAERATRVIDVFPTADRVPENLLKVYVEFSAPMPEGEALARIRLLDDREREIDGAFLRLDAELWDPSRRRLTLLLDPGRVKRGLRANLEAGAPLREGHAVTLAIDGAWRDETGRPLAAGVRKRWQVAAADRSSPDPRRWHIAAIPTAGTRGPLALDFGEPLDRALLARFLTVEDAQGRPVQGEAIVCAREASWQFTPAALWQDADYHLAVDVRLEDLAANRISAPFDVDLAHPQARPEAPRDANSAIRLRIHPRPHPPAAPTAPGTTRGQSTRSLSLRSGPPAASAAPAAR
jgi:hypothetical protein